jgi:hypothetical protein
VRAATALLLLALTASCSYPQFAFAPDTNVVDSAVIETGTQDSALDTQPSVDSTVTDTPSLDTAIADADTAPPPRVWLFDFGGAEAITPGCNNVDTSKAAGGTLANLIDSTGKTTPLSLRVSSIDKFYTNGGNSAGTTMPASSIPFAVSATRDSLFGATIAFMGEVAPKAVVELTGLNASRTYDVDIFASRMGGTGVLESEYTIRGAGTATLTLDANDNTSKMARFTSLTPTTTGSLTLTTTAGPMNTSPYGFYYVGAMRLTEKP